MRNLNELDYARQDMRDVYGHSGDHTCGAFQFKSCRDGGRLIVIAVAGLGWDHVSVSRIDRVPCYEEMAQIGRLFFKDDETAVQYHVPSLDHVNVHPHCLHWWRPTQEKLPRPPSYMV